MRLYSADEMARTASRSCAGCGECCRGMGDTIHLDPYDVRELEIHTGMSFMDLLDRRIDLRVEDGLILPSLSMRPDTGACSFLGADGRCLIHSFRPGLCRLFPLGRDYEGENVRYFVVAGACPRRDLSKVKISRWIGIPDFSKYEAFVEKWHIFVREQQKLLHTMNSAEEKKMRNMALLNIFFIENYPSDRDFYEVFEQRMKRAGCL